MIDNTQEATSDAFADIDDLFLHKKYGCITTYIFGYCLAALFSSRLKWDGLRVPYFLQIACERESNIYRLIHEIVEICDVNTGLIKKCSMDFDYGYCDYDYVTIFPTQSVDKTLNDLVCSRDVPVIIDGYENEKFYGALLRETANIPGKTRVLDIKDKFNILPIFICPIIRSQFKNVFSIGLMFNSMLLLRLNGFHGTTRSGFYISEHHAYPHCHRLSTSDIEKGRSKKPSTIQDLTGKYVNLQTAIVFFCEECGIID